MTKDGLDEALRVAVPGGGLSDGRGVQGPPADHPRRRDHRRHARPMPESEPGRASPGPEQRQPRAADGDHQDARVLRDQAVDKCLVLDGRGGPWRLAHWDVPGGGLTALLTSSLSGTTPPAGFRPWILAIRGSTPGIAGARGGALGQRPRRPASAAAAARARGRAASDRAVDARRAADGRTPAPRRVLERRRGPVPGRPRRRRRDRRSAVHLGRRAAHPGATGRHPAERRRRSPDLCHQRGRSDGRRVPPSAGSRRGPSGERSPRAREPGAGGVLRAFRRTLC